MNTGLDIVSRYCQWILGLDIAVSRYCEVTPGVVIEWTPEVDICEVQCYMSEHTQRVKNRIRVYKGVVIEV